MHDYQTLKIEEERGILTVWLNRPEIRNAFNDVLISELLTLFKELNSHNSINVVLIRGSGKAFCAGADLNWMKSIIEYDFEKNYEESLNLSKCLYAIYSCCIPTIAVVHGAAIGGANGILAACDICYCTDDTVFAFSEVKLGLIPSCISPYVIKRIGETKARELMLTGRRFDGKEAEKISLVNKSCKSDDFQEQLNKTIKQLRSSGPNSLRKCKRLIFEVSNKLSLFDSKKYTAKEIAEARISEEGQEGMKAFLEKRNPDWFE